MEIGKRFDLTGKCALLSGGCGLLGSQFAQALASVGARVAVSDLNGEACEALASEISEQSGTDVLGIQADITRPESISDMVAQVMAQWNKVDILVNCAQSQPMDGAAAAFEDYALDVWNHILNVDITGMFLCCQAVGRIMGKHRGGAILNISSIYGLGGPDFRIYTKTGISPPPAAYSVTKAGVVGLSKYLATYWADKNIRVNVLTPGGVYLQQDPDFVEQYASRTPMGRMANREDLVGAMLYLVSDAAQYVTGHNLVVDGGWTAW